MKALQLMLHLTPCCTFDMAMGKDDMLAAARVSDTNFYVATASVTRFQQHHDYGCGDDSHAST